MHIYVPFHVEASFDDIPEELLRGFHVERYTVEPAECGYLLNATVASGEFDLGLWTDALASYITTDEEVSIEIRQNVLRARNMLRDMEPEDLELGYFIEENNTITVTVCIL